MGLLKKIKRGFKKVTKGVSKVLDKVVPNEIKSYLPYAAALAPYMLPANFAGGSGLAALFRRGLLTGGLNLGSQLAQEGSEGDYNPLSVLLATGQGAMTASGAGNTLRNMRSMPAANTRAANMPSFLGETGFNQPTGFLSKAKNFALNSGAKVADLGASANKTLSDPFAEGNTFTSLSKAAAPAISLGTGDLAYADANRLNKQFEADEAIKMATDAATAAGASAEDIAAVTASMTNYGYDQSEIDNIISQFFSNGGRVGYNMGGRVGYGMGGDIMEGIMGMFKGEEKGPDFNTMAETVETVEMQPKEYLFDNKLKFTVNPGENEMQSVLNALFQDTAGIIPEDRKQEYYDLYIPQLYKSGDISRNEYEGYIEEGILSNNKSMGGIMNNYNMGGSVLPQGMEMDYRGGGFIPMGSAERADDVPARVSKNEFVMTADAVRAAGGGSINQGAKKMYEMMNNLEARA